MSSIICLDKDKRFLSSSSSDFSTRTSFILRILESHDISLRSCLPSHVRSSNTLPCYTMGQWDYTQNKVVYIHISLQNQMCFFVWSLKLRERTSKHLLLWSCSLHSLSTADTVTLGKFKISNFEHRTATLMIDNVQYATTRYIFM